MRQQNRQLFLTGVADIIEDLYGKEDRANLDAKLSERLHPLLDELLLESQPIEGTEATILIADIRGFTALAESLPPKVLIQMLNRYFTLMGQVIERHGGFIDKFMGDAVMALFGAPSRRPDDLLRALTCAVEMQQALWELNRRCSERGEPSLYAGIAVSTGEVMAGSFGSRVHNEYTVIGDSVNLASRIEGYSLRGQVLMSKAVHDAARDHIEVGSVNEVMVKGKSKPVTIYELRRVLTPQAREVPSVEIRKSPRIDVSFPLSFYRVEQKRILAERISGKANDLGYFGLSADLPIGLSPQSEVLLELSPDLGKGGRAELYARVIHAWPKADSYRTSLEFTTLDTPGHLLIKRYVDKMIWGR